MSSGFKFEIGAHPNALPMVEIEYFFKENKLFYQYTLFVFDGLV